MEGTVKLIKGTWHIVTPKGKILWPYATKLKALVALRGSEESALREFKRRTKLDEADDTDCVLITHLQDFQGHRKITHQILADLIIKKLELLIRDEKRGNDILKFLENFVSLMDTSSDTHSEKQF